MKPRRRSKTGTVLDQLERDGIVDSTLIADLREFANGMRAGGPLLQRLMLCLSQPARADSRDALRLAQLLKLEHDYYVSIGEKSPVEKVARWRNVSRRTVSSALKRVPALQIMTPDVRAPWLCDWLDAAHAEFVKSKVGTKTR
jgi:hypothetical protein